MNDQRKLIAEAMEAHDGKEWLATGDRVREFPDGDCMFMAHREDARSIALSHNALPVAVGLIEELTAERDQLRKDHERSRSIGKASHDELMRVRQMAFEAHTDKVNPSYAAECVVKRLVGDFRVPAEHLRPGDRFLLKATIATQAKEIERLRCLFNDAAAFDEAGQPGDGMYIIQKELGAYDE